MKKVLFFIDTLGHGGAEKVLVNLVNNLDKSKYDITLMTIFDCGVNKSFLKKEIKYKYIFKKLFYGNVTLFKLFSPGFLYRHFIKDEYDIVVSYLEGNTTRILSGCPCNETKKLAWIHVEMDEATRFHPYRSKKECIECYRNFDKIIGVSESVIDSFKKHLGAWDNLCVKYNAVETDYIRRCSNEIIEFEFDKNSLNLVSVGRLIEQKAYKRLLSIHKRLIDEGENVRLYIIGEGAEKNMLEEYIKKHNLSDSAFLLGFKENPWKYVSKADLFVCSSLKEGFSTAVTESLIVGTPVVTTLCSGMREMLGDSEYGLIVENDEDSLYMGIKSLIEDKALLEQYNKKAKERGNCFSTHKTVKEVENLLDVISK